MKKIILILSVAIASTSNFIAQIIPNGGFENWNSISYEEPTPWNTSNRENLRRGIAINATKVTGVSGFAIRLETIINATDTSFAYISNTPGDPTTGEGGVPFSQIPTAFTGSFRYNLGATDSAIFLVFFKKNGVVISQDFFQYRGATGNQPTFTPFSFPLTVSTIPDSVIVAVASSNAFTYNGIQNGSFIELDNLGFTGPGVTQQLIGGDFENWTVVTQNTLSSWLTQGEGVSKVSPGYNSPTAVQISTIDYGPQDGIHPSAISFGEQSQTGPIGGIPYNHMVDTICGYYKYFTPSPNDSAAVLVNTLQNGISTGGSYNKLAPASNWTYFEFEVFSGMTPDTININIHSSSNWPVNNAAAGSTLIIDDVHLKSQQVGLKSNNPFEMIISVYPNPTTDVLNLKWNKSVSENVTMKVYSINGQLISSEVIESGNNSTQLHVKDFVKGIYLITISSSSKTWKTSFIKE